MTQRITADNYFSIVPEWVLYADISALAVRLYATLQRYADKDSGGCHPSRKTLADKCNLSLSSLDRALIELVEIGAIHKQQRLSDKGDFTSNIYTVITNAGVSSQVNRPTFTGGDTGIFTGEEQTRASVKQSQEHTAAQSIADDWWNAYKTRTGGKTPTGKGAWHSLLAIINGALKAGWSEEQVTTALMALNVPSATMLDVQLNKLLAPAMSAPTVKKHLPTINGADDCVVCGGDGFLVDYDPEEQQHKSRWCDCRTEMQKPHP